MADKRQKNDDTVMTEGSIRDKSIHVLSIQCDEGEVAFEEAYTAEAVVAEMGTITYLEASWISEVPEEISFEKNNESIHQYMVDASNEDIDRLIQIRESGHIYTTVKNAYRSKYGEVFTELAKEISKKLEEEGYFEEFWEEDEKLPSWYQPKEE